MIAHTYHARKTRVTSVGIRRILVFMLLDFLRNLTVPRMVLTETQPLCFLQPKALKIIKVFIGNLIWVSEKLE